MNVQTEILGVERGLPQFAEFLGDVVRRAGFGVACGLEFDRVGFEFLGHRHLLDRRVDEQRHEDAGVGERGDRIADADRVRDDVQAAFGRQLGPLFGDDCRFVRLQGDGDADHFVARGHLEVQPGGDGRAEQRQVAVLDVPPVFAEVNGNAVRPAKGGKDRRGDGVRLATKAGLPQRGDVIDVDAESDHHVMVRGNGDFRLGSKRTIIAMLIDTHAHLFDERLTADLDAVIARATAAGVTGIVAVGIDAATNRPSVHIAKRFPGMVAAVGIQPNHVGEMAPADWDEVVHLAEVESVVTAIGETGLDRYWDRAPFGVQQEMFARHLELGRRLDKAVVIHCREAEADVVAMLREQYDRYGPIRGVMHSYTGDWAHVEASLAMGLHVSFAGMVTYKTADNLRDVAKAIPTDRLLVETDCPYLAPQAVRGQRNEPAFVVHTAKRLAEVRGEAFEEFCLATTENARKLFAFPG